MPTPRARTLCCAIAVIVSGCATSLSSFQPAHVPAKGHLGVEAGVDLSVPTGTVTRTIDAAETLANAARTRSLSQDEQVQLFEAGANLALNPPFFVQHIGLTYTPVERWEVGIRYAAKAWRLGGRHQLVAQEDRGYDLTVGLGIQRFTFELPIDSVLDVVRLSDFVRWNVDVPVVVGRHGDFYRLWGGPRVVLSRFSSEMVLTTPPSSGVSAQEQVASASGTGVYLGGQGGVALGYKKLFVGLELTVVRLLGGARLQAFGSGRDVDMSTWVVYPGLAVMGEL